jgi:hypothetical protein
MHEEGVDDIPPAGNHTGVSPERRTWVKSETKKVLSKNVAIRRALMNQIDNDKSERERKYRENLEERNIRWQAKTRSSPFGVDLVAENERLTEERRIRINDLRQSTVILDGKRERAKNDIILQVRQLSIITYC